MSPWGQSSLRSIFNAIIHMHHTTYILQNTHAIETKPRTHTHATIRSIFSQTDLQHNHSHAPHDLQTAKYTRNRNKATNTQTCHCQMLGSALKIWTATTYGSIWSEWTVCKGSWCPWSRDENSTSLQRNNNKAINTDTCHRHHVNLLSDRSSTQSFTCATRLTPCKIHTQ